MLRTIIGYILPVFICCLISNNLLAQATAKKPNGVKVNAAKKTPAAVKQPVAPLWKPLAGNERLVEIKTDYGVMIAKLYNETPLHRDNFVKLVQNNFYDSLLFHRVINQFMIQGGDPASKIALQNVTVGGGTAPGDRIPAEFNAKLFHKKGALSAARDNNEAKASSNSQFYIVHGKPIPEPELNTIVNQRIKPNNPAFNYTPFQKNVYGVLGGTPFLDQNYTVFGEVISGLEVIDKIAALPTNPGDRPKNDVRMFVRLLN